MKRTVRQTLAHSHVAAIAIAALLVWSLQLMWYRLIFSSFGISTALVDLLRNFFSPRYVPLNWKIELKVLYVSWIGPAVGSILNAILYVAVAFLLARWVYGQGPLRSLRKCRETLAGRAHV
jgi:ABC-type phosphate/phosphonate transport system permease subunit